MFMTGVLCTVCGAQVYLKLYIKGMSVFFSRFMGYESQCGTNKSREPRSGSRAICLFRTAIHIP